jgi:heterotetrameric sarcosine oxidase delta subunit
MAFLLTCPHCGPRPFTEFAYGGESGTHGGADGSLAAELYLRDNVAGVQRESWFHRFGCERWFSAERDTRTNAVLATEPEAAPASAR